MLSPIKLIEMTRRRRISTMKNPEACSVADEGHFVVYPTEGKRFMVPLAYLGSNIFRGLLKVSEEEFGLGGNIPITLLCNAVFMELVMSLLQGRVSEDVERTFFSSVFADQCSASSLPHAGNSREQFTFSF